MLQSMDSHWREHLSALDHLRQGIHLRSYAQKQPKQEYKREAFELFSAMLTGIKAEVTQITTTVQVRAPEDVQAVELHDDLSNVQYQHAGYDEAQDFAEAGSRNRRPGSFPRSDATTPARAGRARSSSSATAS